MTTEFVLLLGLFAFILLGALVGNRGPVKTFQASAPRLAAKIERDISVGHKFNRADTGEPTIMWHDPNQ